MSMTEHANTVSAHGDSLSEHAEAVRTLTVGLRVERRIIIALLLLIFIALAALVAKAAPEPDTNVIAKSDVLQGLLLKPPVLAQLGGFSIARIQFLSGGSYVNTSSGNPFPVTCVSGCTAAATFSDNGAFTVGTTAINVIGALYDTGASPAIANGNAGRVRMDSSSYLYTDCVVGCSGGSTTPTDAFANPTTAGLQFDLLAGFNGTTWDRLRVDGSKNLFVNVANSSLPVTGTFWQTTQPVSGTFFQASQPVTIVDGGSVALGSKADAKSTATDTTAITIMQVLKEISALEQAPASRAVTAVSGAFVSGAIADGGIVTLGAKADAKSAATDTTAITIMQVLKEISSLEQAPASRAVTNTTASNFNAQAVGAGADGSATSGNPVLIAGKGSGNANVPVVCDHWAPFSLASATALKIITLASSKNTYICSIQIVSAGANNVALIDGTNSTTDCNAATHGLAGGTTAATGWNFAANGGLTQGSGIGVIAATVTVSHDVCLLASATTQVSGVISYTQF